MNSSLKFRAIGVIAWIALVILGQAVSLAFHTSRLWPFNSIPVYHNFLASTASAALEVYLLSAEGEISLASTGLADRHISLAFSSALDRTSSKIDSDHIAKLYFDYAKARAKGPFPYNGLRIYRRVRSLDRGQIVESRLRGEHLIR
jgi:hypothetical protein